MLTISSISFHVACLTSDRTIYKEQRITIYKLPYRVELVKEQPEFRAKVPYDCQLRVRYQDGTPAKGAAFEVKVEGAYTTDRRVAYTSDAAGVIKLTLQPEASSESIDITVRVVCVRSVPGEKCIKENGRDEFCFTHR